MKKEARLLCLWLTAAVIAGLGGCAHKPAYSEMDTNRKSSTQNKNQPVVGEGTIAAPSPVEPPAGSPAAAPAPPPPTAAFKTPSFMDQSKGGISDLPAYPGAFRVSVQVGPIEGANTMSLVFKTAAPMDKIAAFYERVIKDNKWTVADKIIDPEFSEWNLKKGEANNAKVQIKKDQQTSAMNIIIVRAEKVADPAK